MSLIRITLRVMRPENPVCVCSTLTGLVLFLLSTLMVILTLAHSADGYGPSTACSPCHVFVAYAPTVGGGSCRADVKARCGGFEKTVELYRSCPDSSARGNWTCYHRLDLARATVFTDDAERPALSDPFTSEVIQGLFGASLVCLYIGGCACLLPRAWRVYKRRRVQETLLDATAPAAAIDSNT